MFQFQLRTMLAVIAVFAALLGGWTGVDAVGKLVERGIISPGLAGVVGSLVAVIVLLVTLVDVRGKNVPWFMAGCLPTALGLLGFFFSAGDPFSIVASLVLGTIPGVQLASARSIWRNRDVTPVPGQKWFAVPVRSAPWLCLLISTAALGMLLRITHLFITELAAAP